MFETPFTVVGNVITDVVARRAGESNVVTFRMASNSRKKTDDGWEPGNSLYITVNCWGRVADGVAGRLFKCDPVVVVGYIFTSDYVDKECNRRSSMEVRATSVGPDMARCQVKVDPRRPSPLDLEAGPEQQPQDQQPETEKADGLALSV